MARKIGSITPLWNQELFIKPHFDMLSSLDKNLVLMHDRPLPSYHNEHGYSNKKDLSEYILRKYFPNVEIQKAMYPPELDFGPGLYNEGLVQMLDCDIVLRLDPDMLWTKKNWDEFINLLRTTDNDSYVMDFAKDSVNYYMTGDFEHGLMDAKEFDPLAVNPEKLFKDEIPLYYPATNPMLIKLDNWICHHFRGWNKPKSTPAGWADTLSKEYLAEYGNEGGWFECDPEIRKKMEEWLIELVDIKYYLQNKE